MDDVEQRIAAWNAYSMRSTLRGALAKGGDAEALRQALDDLPDIDALGALRANAEAVNLLVGRRWYVMRDAREAGATWAQIGEAVGLTEQQARHFYADKIAFQETYAPDFHEAERSRAALDDPAEWQDSFGESHRLWPVGTKVTFTGHVLLHADGGTMYESAPATIIGHELDDEVTPYRVRIDADGEDFMCMPDQVRRAESGDE